MLIELATHNLRCFFIPSSDFRGNMHEETHQVIASRQLKTGALALRECGMQPEFAASLLLMQNATGTSLILRAGSPPVYDRPRSPKTGLNLSKTSNQGFFKGSLAEDPQFTRVQTDLNGTKTAIGHHKKDTHRLESGQQNTVVLPVRMRDIIRELREGGDLQLTKIGASRDGTTELRFCYKEGKGDKDFKGEFVIRMSEGQHFQATDTRAWDRPENDPEYDTKKRIIPKPKGVLMSDRLWERLYDFAKDKEFPLSYTTQANSDDLMPAKVFANNEGLIVTGDWDGLALGHPPDLPENAKRVYNTFSDDPSEKLALIKQTRILLDQFKTKIDHKELRGEPLSNFEIMIRNTRYSDLYTEFSLQRAGCITAFEFLTNSVANCAYKEAQRNYVRDESKLIGMEQAYESGVQLGRKLSLRGATADEALKEASKHAKAVVISEQVKVANAAASSKEERVTETEVRRSHSFRETRSKLFEHIDKHLAASISSPGEDIRSIPHPDYDTNIQDLFQHGYDMRNPYGSNLEGAWLLVSNDGMILHGKTQEDLIEIMLSGDFLEKNHIDINFAADMSAGWHKVVSKQLALGQNVPDKTRESLLSYQQNQEDKANSSQDDISVEKPHADVEQSRKSMLFGFSSQSHKPADDAVPEITLREDQDVRSSPRK